MFLNLLRKFFEFVLEENNYYPFGLKHKGYNNTNVANPNYKYKYNGKELQDDFNINLYDYGARNYDPAIGRWFNIDPLAEKSRRFSPYTYALNNPVFFIDPDGMEATSTHTDKFGKVIKVIDDGDLGIYKHDGDKKFTENEIKTKYNKNNTSAGGTKMGRSLTKYSFTKGGDFNKPSGKINFGSNKNEVTIQNLINHNGGIVDYGLNASNNQLFDIKSSIGKDESMYDGSIIFTEGKEDVYGSYRDAGNFLAGERAEKSIVSTETLLKGFGAFNASGNNKVATLGTLALDAILGGNYLNSKPYYGEDPQSGAAIEAGVKYSSKFKNYYFFPKNKPVRK
ncbi:RHS repeat domain-containing protein [Empedobacter brevis]